MYLFTNPGRTSASRRNTGNQRAAATVAFCYGTGVNQANWGLMVFVMLGLGAVVLLVSLAWREPRTR